MTALTAYTEAVARRKSIERRGITPVVNFSIAAQLEGHDIPLLLEIVRVFNEAVSECLEHCGGVDGDGEPWQLTGEDADKMLKRLTGADSRINDLVRTGNLAKWGGAR